MEKVWTSFERLACSGHSIRKKCRMSAHKACIVHLLWTPKKSRYVMDHKCDANDSKVHLEKNLDPDTYCSRHISVCLYILHWLEKLLSSKTETILIIEEHTDGKSIFLTCSGLEITYKL